MNIPFRNTGVLLFASLLLIFSGSAMAQRTGDHIVPAIETVCDGDPFSFGLCNSYCEALDCDSETPLGTPRACANIRDNYLKKSDGVAPPCEQEVVSCPCNFDPAPDFAELVALARAAEENQVGTGVDLTLADIDANLAEYCSIFGPGMELLHITDATQIVTDIFNSGKGLRLYQWVSADSCVVEGGGFDGGSDPTAPGGNFTYGPFINESFPLEENEVAACETALQLLCNQIAP